EQSRPRHDETELAADHMRQAVIEAVAGDFTQVLPTASQRDLLLAQRKHLGKLAIHPLVLTEEMPPLGAECAERAAKHALAQVAVTVAAAVERLLAAVIDARDAERRGIERERAQHQRGRHAIRRKPRLVLALSHLVVVV